MNVVNALRRTMFKWIPNEENIEQFKNEVDEDDKVPSTEKEEINIIQFVNMVETYGIMWGDWSTASGVFGDMLEYIDSIPDCWLGIIGNPKKHMDGMPRIVCAVNEDDAINIYEERECMVLGRLELCKMAAFDESDGVEK